jgi:acetyl esterase/lipase
MICPGGGYVALAPHESEPVAQWINGFGFHAAVLRYRRGPHHRHPAPIQDAQRGLRMLRSHAEEWGIDPQAIGVLGFSAGGHLASSLAVHHDRFHHAGDDLAGHVSARPDAAVLCYPVIDMVGVATHAGSRFNLLGEEPTPELLSLMATHNHVTDDTPPTFLWHTVEDAAVPMENSFLFASACRAAGVPVEVHVYETGKHGLGLAPDQPDVRTWTDHAAAFLQRHLLHGAPA